MPTPRSVTRTDGSITWKVPFRLPQPGGKPKQTSETFDDFESARKFADLIEKHGVVEALRVLEVQRSAVVAAPTVTEWCNFVVDHLSGVEPYTKKKYRQYIVNDIDPFMGHLPLDAVTQFTDAAWVIHMEEEKEFAAKTIHNKHGFFSSAMKAAATLKPQPLIPYNPCADTRLPKIYPTRVMFLEPDEYGLFVGAMPDRWVPQVEFSTASMARPAEIAALLVGDINRDTGAVDISKAFKYTGGRLKLGPPKTQRGVRVTNVPMETLDLLDLDRPKSELLFHTYHGNPIRPCYLYQKAFVPALQKLIVLDENGDVVSDELKGKRPSPYWLRHTGISWRLLGGAPLFVVSRDAGHESAVITDKVYGHLDRSASADAAKVFAARLPRLHRPILSIAA
ncbi:tyrosine-type recombinase/integrase [Nocardia sp. CA-135953]|uniref:tyrosine-type recombinase/integrase n=1 Tax=Nocardia sp. CA-135953 TaxID=3239978 RepID=UPI003D97319C